MALLRDILFCYLFYGAVAVALCTISAGCHNRDGELDRLTNRDKAELAVLIDKVTRED